MLVLVSLDKKPIGKFVFDGKLPALPSEILVQALAKLPDIPIGGVSGDTWAAEILGVRNGEMRLDLKRGSWD